MGKALKPLKGSLRSERLLGWKKADSTFIRCQKEDDYEHRLLEFLVWMHNQEIVIADTPRLLGAQLHFQDVQVYKRPSDQEFCWVAL